MGASWGPWGAAHQEHTAQCGGGAECLQRVMGQECASCSRGLGLARGSLAGTLCRGARVPRLGEQTPDHASGPHPPVVHPTGVWAAATRSVLDPCLEVAGQHACILAPRGDPQVCPHSLQRSLVGQLSSSVPSWLPAVPWISPASLPNELFTLSQVCCCGTQKDTDPRGAGGSASARGVNGRGWNGQWRPLCTDRLGW